MPPGTISERMSTLLPSIPRFSQRSTVIAALSSDQHTSTFPEVGLFIDSSLYTIDLPVTIPAFLLFVISKRVCFRSGEPTEVAHFGRPVPACSATTYVAYQSA